MTLTLDAHTSPAEVESLRSEWDTLVQGSRLSSPFVTWEWIWTWWECFSERSEPRVMTVRDEGGLVGIAPFVIRTISPRGGPRRRELSFMGSNPVAPDHLDVAVLPGYEQAVASTLVDHLRAHGREWDVFRFDGISAESLLLLSLLKCTSPRWRVSSHVSCPFIRLPATWEEYQASLGQKLRYNLRSRARRLRREAPAEVHLRTVSDPAELPAAVSALFTLHDRVRSQQGVPSTFTGPDTEAFHRRVADLFHRNGWLRLHLLSVGEEPIAAAHCFHYGKIAYFYQTAYDPDWARYGPGAAILARAVQSSIEEGASEFDFLRGDEPYKLQWANDCRTDLRAYLASSRKGKLLVPAYRMKQRLQARRAAPGRGG